MIPIELSSEVFISSYFGEERSYNGGPRGGHHGGTDIAAPTDTPIHVTNDGIVVMAERVLNRGNCVVVDHGAGIFSRHGHMNALRVLAGDVVAEGDVIGVVGSTDRRRGRICTGKWRPAALLSTACAGSMGHRVSKYPHLSTRPRPGSHQFRECGTLTPEHWPVGQPGPAGHLRYTGRAEVRATKGLVAPMTLAQRLALTASALPTLFRYCRRRRVRTRVGVGTRLPRLADVPRRRRSPRAESTRSSNSRTVSPARWSACWLTAVAAWRAYRHAPLVTWGRSWRCRWWGSRASSEPSPCCTNSHPKIVAMHLITAMLVLSVELACTSECTWKTRVTPAALRRCAPHHTTLDDWLWPPLAGWRLMWIGGYMAESGASAACSGWPLCNGSALPAADDQEITHMIHRYLAGLFTSSCRFSPRGDRVAAARGTVLGASLCYRACIAVHRAGGGGCPERVVHLPHGLAVARTVIASGVWFTLASAIILTFYQPANVRADASVPAGAAA